MDNRGASFETPGSKDQALDQTRGGNRGDEPPRPDPEIGVADGIKQTPRQLRSEQRCRDRQQRGHERNRVAPGHELVSEIGELDEMPERLDRGLGRDNLLPPEIRPNEEQVEHWARNAAAQLESAAQDAASERLP